MTDLVAVHPGTGEVLEHLDQQAAETLAEALDAVHARQAELHARQTELKQWQRALETELRRRLKTKLAVFGEWEVKASRSGPVEVARSVHLLDAYPTPHLDKNAPESLGRPAGGDETPSLDLEDLFA